VKFRNKSVDPKDVQFALLDNGKIAGIHLFIPNFREDDMDLMQIAYLLLDGALGEFDVEMHLGLIEILPTAAVTEDDRYPFFQLPILFDQLVSQLSGRPELPVS
jgi:hypothetical protein